MSELREAYQRRFDSVLKPLARAIESHLANYLKAEPRIDRVVARAKAVDRFVEKARVMEKGRPKYHEPLEQIQDQVGARIIAFYLSDVPRIVEVIERYYRSIEARDLLPESEWEFGYFGRHYVLLVPTELIEPGIDRDMLPRFFELQIKTLFQHAWSEAEHDLGYKPGGIRLGSDAKRRLAFTAAQAWGADRVFDELFQEAQASGEDL